MRAARSKVAPYIYTMSLQRLVTESVKHTTTYVFGTARNILLGAGLSYAIEQENRRHIPLIIIFPSIYAGYHAHQNKDALLDWIIASKKKLKSSWL
jgi:hypothetical protein